MIAAFYLPNSLQARGIATPAAGRARSEYVDAPSLRDHCEASPRSMRPTRFFSPATATNSFGLYAAIASAKACENLLS